MTIYIEAHIVTLTEKTVVHKLEKWLNYVNANNKGDDNDSSEKFEFSVMKDPDRYERTP